MSFEASLDQAVLAHADAKDLGDLATRLGEVFPTHLLNRVINLHRNGKLENLRLAEPPQRQPTYRPIDDGLPIPHPLDGDWRLDAASRERMTALLLGTSAGEKMLLLGVPTVFQRLFERAARVTLVDGNPSLREALGSDGVITANITRAEPAMRSAACVFADPPWYPNRINHFLWYAVACMSMHGTLYFSIPGVFTRPSVADERVAFFEFAKQCGLEPIRLEPHALRYESPPFEIATLTAAGLPGFPPRWRSGDLVTFRKVHNLHAIRPERVAEVIWRRQSLGNVDIRFKVRAHDAFDPTPHALGESSVRLDVTSRDPLLESVDVWTSGNQIFRSSHPVLLADLAELLNNGAADCEMIESKIGRRLLPHEWKCVRFAMAELQRITFADATRGRAPSWDGSRDDTIRFENRT